MNGATERRIADVCLQYGRGKSPSYVDHSEIRVINQACIYWDGLHLENVKYQNEAKFKAENKLRDGAVLLNATGTGTLGRSYIFQGQSGTYMADGHVSVFYTKDDVLLPRMLQVFFSLPSTQDTIYANCVSGTTNQIELSKEKVGEVLVPIPNMELQKQYVGFVEQSDKSKFTALMTSNINRYGCSKLTDYVDKRYHQDCTLKADLQNEQNSDNNLTKTFPVKWHSQETEKKGLLTSSRNIQQDNKRADYER